MQPLRRDATLREAVHGILKAAAAPPRRGAGPAWIPHAAAVTRLEGTFCRALRGGAAAAVAAKWDCPDIVQMLYMLRKLPGAHGVWDVLAPVAMKQFLAKNEGGYTARVKRKVYVEKAEVAPSRLHLGADLTVLGTKDGSAVRQKGIDDRSGKLLRLDTHDVRSKEDVAKRLRRAPGRVLLEFGGVEPHVSGKEYALLLWALAVRPEPIPALLRRPGAAPSSENRKGGTASHELLFGPAGADASAPSPDEHDAWSGSHPAAAPGAGAPHVAPYTPIGEAMYCSLHGLPPPGGGKPCSLTDKRLTGRAAASAVLAQASRHQGIVSAIDDVCVMLWAARALAVPAVEVLWLFERAEAYFASAPPSAVTMRGAVRVWTTYVKYATTLTAVGVPQEQLWAVLRPHVLCRGVAWSAQHYCNALWCTVHGRMEDPALLDTLQRVGTRLSAENTSFTPAGIAAAVWASVSLQLAADTVFREGLLRAALTPLRATAPRIAKKDCELVLSSLLWAHAQLLVPVPGWVVGRAAAAVPAASVDFLSRCLAVCGTLHAKDVGSPQLADPCLLQFQELRVQEQMRPEQFAKCLIGVAKLRAEAPTAALATLRDRMAPAVEGGVSARVAVQCLWAAAVLGLRPPAFFHAVACFIMDGAAGAPPPALEPVNAVQAYWSFVRAGASVTPELRDRLLGAFCKAPQEATAADVASLLEALCMLPQVAPPPSNVVAAALQRLDALAAHMTHRAAAELMGSLAVLRVSGEHPVVELLQQRAVQDVTSQPTTADLIFSLADRSSRLRNTGAPCRSTSPRDVGSSLWQPEPVDSAVSVPGL